MTKQYQREYYEAHKEKHLQQCRDYYARNKAAQNKRCSDNYVKNKTKRDAYSKEYRRTHPRREYDAAYDKKYKQLPESRYRSYKLSAKRRNIAFVLTYEEFMTLWQKPCWYASCPIDTIGLDRIVNAKGYSIDNVIPCCATHNKMRMEMDREAYLLECNRIAKTHPRPV